MRTVSEDRFMDMVTAEVYMRSIMDELGASTPAEALEVIRGQRQRMAA